MSSVLLTGASGFVGHHLVNYLAQNNVDVRLLGRRDVHNNRFPFFETNFSCNDCFLEALDGVETVIHCAARVHVMKETATNPINEFRAFNVDATLSLAKQAAISGAKRFIFLSTIKVNGETTTGARAFSAFDEPSPIDPYAISKAEAEYGLQTIAKDYGMEFVIIRPPLVYGPGVKANFAALMKLVNKNVPLPFGMIKANRRSMVSVHNLVDLIFTCIEHPNACNRVFLVSDEVDLSTNEMIKLMAKACGKKSLSVPIPITLFKVIGAVLNKTEVVDRLLGSLQLDSNYTKETLDWHPPQKTEDGFVATAYWLKNGS